MDKVMQAMMEPIKTEPVFQLGQTVRVILNIDVNFPSELDYWLNSKCEVIEQKAVGLVNKRWVYILRHPNGRTCEFSEDEIDGRYKRKPRSQ